MIRQRNTFCIPKTQFEAVPDLDGLLPRLFGRLGDERGL